jgi:GH25 family lysozyme M1 (1,4-beta-N-acetylmuramidase)
VIRFVDASGYTGPNVRWAEVKAAGVVGVYFEAQVGNDAPNEFFEAQVKGARDEGLLAGFYHFAEALPEDGVHANRDPQGQLALAWKVAEPLAPFELIPILDAESPEPQNWIRDRVTSAFESGWLAAGLAQLDLLTGVRAGIYTGAGYWPAMRGAGLLDCFSTRALWFGKYLGSRSVWPADDCSLPTPCPPWTQCDAWQWGDELMLGGARLDGSVATDAGWQRFLVKP